jgi:flagellar protein FliL
LGKFKLLIIALGAGAILGAVYFFALPMVLGKSSGLPLITSASAEAQAAPTVTAEENGILYETQERVFNLADEDTFRYLKAKVVFVFAEEGVKTKGLSGEAYKKVQEEFTSKHQSQIPEIEDAITTIMTSKTSADLISAEGKEGLKTELSNEVGKIVTDTKLMSVYFTQFIIQ